MPGGQARTGRAVRASTTVDLLWLLCRSREGQREREKDSHTREDDRLRRSPVDMLLLLVDVELCPHISTVRGIYFSEGTRCFPVGGAPYYRQAPGVFISI